MFADFYEETLFYASRTCGRQHTAHRGRFFRLHPCTSFFKVFSCNIKRLSDARLDSQQSERSGQIQRRIISEQLACGWALSVSVSLASPNYRQQWHHTDSGLLAEIMRGPTPGVKAPVHVSGFFFVLKAAVIERAQR